MLCTVDGRTQVNFHTFAFLHSQGNSVVHYLLGPEALLACARSSTHHPLDDDSYHVLLRIEIPVKLEKRPVKPKLSVRQRLYNFEDHAYPDMVSGEAGGESLTRWKPHKVIASCTLTA